MNSRHLPGTCRQVAFRVLTLLAGLGLSSVSEAAREQVQRLDESWVSLVRPVELVVIVQDVDLDYIEALRRDRSLEIGARTVATGAGFAAGAVAAAPTMGAPGVIAGGTTIGAALIPIAMVTGMGSLLSADEESEERDAFHREIQREARATLDSVHAREDFDRALARSMAQEIANIPWIKLVGEPRVITAPENEARAVRAEYRADPHGHDLLLLTIRRGLSGDLGECYLVADLRLFARAVMPLAYHWRPFVAGSGKPRSLDWTDYPVFRKRFADIVAIAVPGASRHPGFVADERKRIEALIDQAKRDLASAEADRARRKAAVRTNADGQYISRRPVRDAKRRVEDLEGQLAQVAEYEHETEAALRDLAARMTAEDALLYRQVQQQTISSVVSKLVQVLGDTVPAGGVRRIEAY